MAIVLNGWYIDVQLWYRFIEYDHVKGNIVHMFYHIQNVGQIPLEQFKDIILNFHYKKTLVKKIIIWYSLIIEPMIDYLYNACILFHPCIYEQKPCVQDCKCGNMFKCHVFFIMHFPPFLYGCEILVLHSFKPNKKHWCACVGDMAIHWYYESVPEANDRSKQEMAQLMCKAIND